MQPGLALLGGELLLPNQKALRTGGQSSDSLLTMQVSTSGRYKAHPCLCKLVFSGVYRHILLIQRDNMFIIVFQIDFLNSRS